MIITHSRVLQHIVKDKKHDLNISNFFLHADGTFRLFLNGGIVKFV